MYPQRDRLARERLTMKLMVGLYCADHHGSPAAALCHDCQQFLDYAEIRLSKCPYGNAKPTCANCPVHCYKRAQKAEAKRIMRYAGPRMLHRHPLLAVAHLLDGLRSARHPRELSRKQRMRG